ncbi:MAG: hypothetical protein V4459_00130 [Pseudomonadota bacterium]
MEGLYASRQITLADIQSVYEALFLRGVTGFEAFLESLFLGILRQKLTYPRSRVSLRMTAANDKALMEILMRNEPYLQWIPFHRTEERAKLFLAGGRPFSELDGGHRSTLATVTKIRNAIAHNSPHAKREFERKVIGTRVLLRGEKTPAGFLRSQANPRQKRFEIYMMDLASIAVHLS